MGILEELDYYNLELDKLNEAEYNKTVNHLRLEIMDVEKFIRNNECQKITNPIFFARENVPSPDGLLSNEIFGITKEDRAGIFAYIDLQGTFIDPSCYKVWCSIDKRIKQIVHGTEKYIIDSRGELIESEDGENGIEFLQKNFKKIKIKSTESRKRDIKITYLNHNYDKDRMFITKYIVIPAYYRDINTNSKYVEVGEINRLYANIIRLSNSLLETQDYGIPRDNSIVASIQEQLLTIYDWFCGNTNSSIKEKGAGISGKFGVLRRANLSKTADYSSRLVLSAQELKVETIDDIMVNLDRSAVPLAAVIADFFPFMMFFMRRFFENEFVGISTYSAIDKNGNIIQTRIQDPMIVFSDDKIKKELNKFLHSYSSRFRPIIIPLEDSNKFIYMKFKGRGKEDSKHDTNPESIYNRRLTWCDVIYQAAVEAVKNKKIIITRYPIDSFYNQVPSNIVVSSTKETEPVYIDNEYYPFYPKIRESDIDGDTSNLFVDTMQISNLFLKGLTADFDGDQVTVKGSFFKETNDEIERFMNSKINFIDLGVENKRVSSNEAIQSLYNLTKILSEDESKLTGPVF